MTLRAHWLLAGLVLGSLVTNCQCACQNNPHGDGDTGAPADAARDGVVEDAVVWALDAWVPRDACDATKILLPPTGDTVVGQVSNMARYVAYDNRIAPETIKRGEVFLYDLETCFEYQLTDRDWDQGFPFLWGNEVVFRDYVDEQSLNAQLVSFDISTLTFSVLEGGDPATHVVHNGRHLVYQRYTDVIGAVELTLWDRQNGQKRMLAEAAQGAETLSISATHAAWVAWGGPGKDVFYVELETMEVHHVGSTAFPTVYNTTTWGDYVLWDDDRYGLSEVMALRISTGQEWRLSDGTWRATRPKLRGHIVCMLTVDYSPGEGVDLMLYDMETGVRRRVTTEARYGYKSGYVDSGWLVYQEEKYPGDIWRNKIWALNLLKLGIVDADGHVVPE